MKYVLICLTFFGGLGVGVCQSTFMHFDRPYYLPGQIIFYSISSTYAAQDSFILQMQLSNDREVLGHHFNMLRSGTGNGYFQLPFELFSGNYILSADAFDGKTMDVINLMQAAVSILNPQDFTGDVPQLNQSDFKQPDISRIEIEITSNRVATRTLLTAKIKVANGKANELLSISVKDHSLYKDHGIYVQSHDLNRTGLSTLIPIRGTRKFLNANPKSDAFLFAAEPNDMYFSFSRVEPEGNFVVKFPGFYGLKQIYFVDNASNHIDVKIASEKAIEVKQSLLSPCPEAALNLSVHEEKKKIYELFSTLEETVTLTDTNKQHTPILPDYSIDVQDFSVRGKLVDLLKEITTPLKFRKGKDGVYSTKFLYELLDLKYFYDSDPLFFINGMATQDGNYVASLLLQDVKSIKLYSALQTIRALRLVDIGGVGVIEMLDPLFAIPEDIRLPGFELQGLQIPVNYPIQVDVTSKVPQLKALLFWQPEGRLNSQGEYIFSIPMSDDITTYEIEAVHHASQTVQNILVEVFYK